VRIVLELSQLVSPITHSSLHVAPHAPFEQNGAAAGHAVGADHARQPFGCIAHVIVPSSAHSVAPSVHQVPQSTPARITCALTLACIAGVTSVVPYATCLPPASP
jgi:hypothetical protein